jgi:1-acyl-sn-glycerol-3-phosphate acyltransferase
VNPTWGGGRGGGLNDEWNEHYIWLICVYVISSYRNSLIFQDGHVDQSKEIERPGAIVSNHVSYVDILYHMSASFPSFVAKVL